VDWKFSFELITFPVFGNIWMISMITYVFYIIFPFQPVNLSSEWIFKEFILMVGLICFCCLRVDKLTCKHSRLAVWRGKQSGLWTYKPFTAGEHKVSYQTDKVFCERIIGSAVRMADNSLWMDGSATQGWKFWHVLKPVNNKMKQPNWITCTLYEHCILALNYLN